MRPFSAAAIAAATSKAVAIREVQSYGDVRYTRQGKLKAATTFEQTQIMIQEAQDYDFFKYRDMLVIGTTTYVHVVAGEGALPLLNDVQRVPGWLVGARLARRAARLGAPMIVPPSPLIFTRRLRPLRVHSSGSVRRNSYYVDNVQIAFSHTCTSVTRLLPLLGFS